MKFYDMAQIDGEDCAVFSAPLARGRWLFVWVDLESLQPEAILRSEVRREGKVLRQTEILGWHKPEEVSAFLAPAAEWDCSRDIAKGQLAHLGLSEVHKRSIELQEALYAVRNMSRNFTVEQILALMGDVALVVAEPDAPDLRTLPSLKFDYKLQLTALGPQLAVSGTFSAALGGLQRGFRWIRLTMPSPAWETSRWRWGPTWLPYELMHRHAVRRPHVSPFLWVKGRVRIVMRVAHSGSRRSSME